LRPTIIARPIVVAAKPCRRASGIIRHRILVDFLSIGRKRRLARPKPATIVSLEDDRAHFGVLTVDGCRTGIASHIGNRGGSYKSTGIYELERVVEDVRIAVQALAEPWRLYDRVRLQELSQVRVVLAATHVDEVVLEVALVAREALAHATLRGGDQAVGPDGGAFFAEGRIAAKLFDAAAFVGDGLDGANGVVVQVADVGVGLVGFLDDLGDEAAAVANRENVFGGSAVVVAAVFEEAANVSGRALFGFFDDPLVVTVVVEADFIEPAFGVGAFVPKRFGLVEGVQL
jgi:hypothetical protein